MISFSDRHFVFGIRLFVSVTTFTFVLIEYTSGGVGTFLLYNSLTGCPLNEIGEKGFSKIVLLSVTLILGLVAVWTQLMVVWKRKKIEEYPPIEVGRCYLKK